MAAELLSAAVAEFEAGGVGLCIACKYKQEVLRKLSFPTFSIILTLFFLRLNHGRGDDLGIIITSIMIVAAEEKSRRISHARRRTAEQKRNRR